MKNNLLKIIEHYGVMPQLKYFQSEVFELNEAIINNEASLGDDDQDFLNRAWEIGIGYIAEEIADCYVMLEQFRHYYGISNKTIEKIMNYKIERQLERIENE